MNTYTALRQALDAIPFVDDHSYVLHHNIEPAAWEGPYEVLPLARLLLDFNTRRVYIVCGLPEQTVTDILMGRVPPAEQKRLLLSFPEVHTRTVFRYLIRGLQTLYGLPVTCISEENWDMIEAAVAKGRENFYGLLEQVFTGGNIQSSVLNLWAPRCLRYLTSYAAALTPEEKAIDSRFFRFSTTVDYRSMLPFGPTITAYANMFSMPQDTLADYEALLERICQWSVEEMGVCAFKSTEMYFRRLDYRVRSFAEAEPCYKQNRTPEEDRILSDYQAGIICRLAAKYDVPLQIHTGSIYGGFVPADTSPEYLAGIITAYPSNKFDLLHGGDPFFGTMALMGSGFANVYINMSSMPCHSIANFEHWLGIYLDRIPSSHITLGWDLFTPELVSGAAPYMRDMVARVLARKVDAGLYSQELAIEIAHDIMHRSAEKLFGR